MFSICTLRPSLTLLLLGLLLGIGNTALAQQAYRVEYRLSAVPNTSSSWGQAGERWADLVREKTQGRINIRLYTGASLVGGDQTREFPAITQGTIDLAVGSTINWSPQVKELNLFSLPFLLPDHKAIDALTQGNVGQELFTKLEQHGVVPLAWGENGFRELSNSKRPITSPGDLKGMKIRVVGTPIFSDIFSALGAKPILLSFVDSLPALASGVIDGQENPLSIYFGANMPRVGQQHVTLWRYVADPLIFVVNKQVWASWSPQDKQIVQQAAQQAGRESIERSRRNLLEHEPAGVTATHLTPAQRQAFVTATRSVYDKWAKVVGQELVGRAEKAITGR